MKTNNGHTTPMADQEGTAEPIIMSNHVRAACVAVLLVKVGYGSHMENVGEHGKQWAVRFKKPIPPHIRALLVAAVEQSKDLLDAEAKTHERTPPS